MMLNIHLVSAVDMNMIISCEFGLLMVLVIHDYRRVDTACQCMHEPSYVLGSSPSDPSLHLNLR